MDVHFNAVPSPFSAVPKELKVNIFSFLLKSDLFVTMSVCKEWHKLSNEEVSLWKKGVKPENGKDFCLKDEIVRVRQAIFSAKNLERELSRLGPDEGENPYKKDWENQLKESFSSAFESYKSGDISLEQIKKLATLIDEKCQDSKPFEQIFLELKKQGNLDGAIEILGQMKHSSSLDELKSSISKEVKNLMEECVQRNEMDKARSYAIKYKEILKHLEQSKVFDLILLYEKIGLEGTDLRIDHHIQTYPEKDQPWVMRNMIRTCCNTGKLELARTLAIKYEKILDDLEKQSLEDLIWLYGKIGFHEKALSYEMTLKALQMEAQLKLK